eukprot:TRINITY_DN1603_c0_g1_i1.p1 TRINITY_DN1603_c0_g1~~TRINITY_DN1603_c0_g1_i1.p1  ORF type:complete len:207 (-),score=65.40 TRINITY_DN1603_c0_g1_i1:66-686(-)
MFRISSPTQPSKSEKKKAALGVDPSADDVTSPKKHPQTPIRHYKDRIRFLDADNMELKVLIEQLTGEVEDLKTEIEVGNSRLEILRDAIQKIKEEPPVVVINEAEEKKEHSLTGADGAEAGAPLPPGAAPPAPPASSGKAPTISRVLLLAEIRKGQSLKRVSKMVKENKIARSSRMNFGEQLRGIMALRAAHATIDEDEDDDDEWN